MTTDKMEPGGEHCQPYTLNRSQLRSPDSLPQTQPKVPAGIDRVWEDTDSLYDSFRMSLSLTTPGVH